jgi:hypothetical protein
MRPRGREGHVSETTDRVLADDDIRTIAPMSAMSETERPQDADGTDAQDADGRDGDATDMTDGDAIDTTDADGTDTQDSDGTDTTS